MSFKKFCKLFLSQFLIFFLFGVVLLAGFDFFSEKTKSFLESTFFEHFAMKSLVLIFLLCMFTTGAFLITFKKLNATSKLSVFVYNYVIKPPIELGITLSSVAFTLTNSLTFLLLFSDKNKAIALFISSIYILVVAVIYWLMLVVLEENKFLNTDKERRNFGIFLIVSIPVMALGVIPSLM